MKVILSDRDVEDIKLLYTSLDRIEEFEFTLDNSCNPKKCPHDDNEILEELCKFVEKLTNLRSLKIIVECPHCKFGHRLLKIKYPVSLKKLYISNTAVELTPIHMALLICCMKDLVNLESLTLKLCYDYHEVIIPKLPNLKYLKLCGPPNSADYSPIYDDLINLETLIIAGLADTECAYIHTEFYDAMLKFNRIVSKHVLPENVWKKFSILMEEINKNPTPWRFKLDGKIINLRKLKTLKLKKVCTGIVHENVTKLSELKEFIIDNSGCGEQPILSDNVKNMKQLKLITNRAQKEN